MTLLIIQWYKLVKGLFLMAHIFLVLNSSLSNARTFISPRTKEKSPKDLKKPLFLHLGAISLNRVSSIMAQGSDRRLYSCNNCFNPVALSDDLISKAFLVKILPLNIYIYSHIHIIYFPLIHAFFLINNLRFDGGFALWRIWWIWV